MKKVLFSFLAVLFLAVACQSPPEPPIVINVEVRNTNWVHTWADHGDLFSCLIPVPQLTRNIANNGAVMVYLEWTENRVTWQRPLPQAIPATDGVNLWTEHIDFEFSAGFIQIFFTISDFYYEWLPGTHNFRIVLMQ